MPPPPPLAPFVIPIIIKVPILTPSVQSKHASPPALGFPFKFSQAPPPAPLVSAPGHWARGQARVSLPAELAQPGEGSPGQKVTKKAKVGGRGVGDWREKVQVKPMAPKIGAFKKQQAGEQ